MQGVSNIVVMVFGAFVCLVLHGTGVLGVDDIKVESEMFERCSR